MACLGQVESHVAYVMDARSRMKEAEDPQLGRMHRLQLICDASNLIHAAINVVGKQPNLTAMLAECAEQFLEVPR